MPIDMQEAEFVGVFGRAIVRYADRFHSVTWWSPDRREIGVKLAPSYAPGAQWECISQALAWCHNGKRPDNGSYRTPTLQGMPCVSDDAIAELRAVEQSPTWWPLTDADASEVA
jgi:hypothetical protein